MKWNETIIQLVLVEVSNFGLKRLSLNIILSSSHCTHECLEMSGRVKSKQLKKLERVFYVLRDINLHTNNCCYSHATDATNQSKIE